MTGIRSLHAAVVVTMNTIYLPLCTRYSIVSEHVRTYVRTYICTYVRTYVCTYIHTYIRTYVHMYISASMLFEYVHDRPTMIAAARIPAHKPAEIQDSDEQCCSFRQYHFPFVYPIQLGSVTTVANCVFG